MANGAVGEICRTVGQALSSLNVFARSPWARRKAYSKRGISASTGRLHKGLTHFFGCVLRPGNYHPVASGGLGPVQRLVG